MSPTDATDAPFKINKFDGTNFHLWKFKMSMILEEKDLWDVVIGNEKWEDQPDDAARMKFVKRMKK
ncbi:hypothetical protein H257_07285, partial [Aphanomyces astaci]